MVTAQEMSMLLLNSLSLSAITEVAGAGESRTVVSEPELAKQFYRGSVPLAGYRAACKVMRMLDMSCYLLSVNPTCLWAGSSKLQHGVSSID